MVKKSVIFLYFFLMLVLLSLAVTSCRSVKYVPVPSSTLVKDSVVTRDSLVIRKIVNERDSVVMRDSVVLVVDESGNVIRTELYRQKEVYRELQKEYNELLRAFNELKAEKRDTVSLPYPVEKELNRWDRFKVDFGGFALVLLALTIVVGAACVLKLKK